MLFGRLKEVLNNVTKLDVNNIMFMYFNGNEGVKDEVIRLNTDEQLFNKGVDSVGRELESIGGSYSDVTILFKRAEGLPFDRVTLFSTGAFYDSFIVKAQKDGILIEANTFKNGKDLQNRWGDNIIGLTELSLNELVEYILDDKEFSNIIIQEILR
jgi:hypothetical protein